MAFHCGEKDILGMQFKIYKYCEDEVNLPEIFSPVTYSVLSAVRAPFPFALPKAKDGIR